MSCNDLFKIDATLVANEFLDKYMPAANGDYVKVYLYLLRNRAEGIDLESIAESLALTEGDVRRAIRYWEKCGILSLNGKSDESAKVGKEGRAAKAGKAEDAGVTDTEHEVPRAKASRRLGSLSDENKESVSESASERSAKTKTAAAKTAESESEAITRDPDKELRDHYRRTEGKATLNRLSEDAEFKQLLFMVQKYRSKILTEQDEQVLAYLYDGLHLPFDVLDYLVQYCVETNHSSMRYIEKTGLDWATIGIRTVKEAKRRTKEFDRIRTESSKRAQAAKNKQGMTGEARDLDSWLNEVVQRNIQ